MAVNFDLPSPCISVCEIDPKTRYCRGCLRTSREITGWRNLDHDAKLALPDKLRDRRRELGLPTRRKKRKRLGDRP